MLSVQQVAEKMNVSRTTVYEWINEKHLPYTNKYIGTRKVIRIQEEILERWLEENRK